MSEADLPTPPPEVEWYLQRTGHTFQLADTDEDGYIVTEHDRTGVRIDQKVLGRFPQGCPAPLVIQAMRDLAGV